jgi:tetratricopeptide (TPR) repeat protein
MRRWSIVGGAVALAAAGSLGAVGARAQTPESRAATPAENPEATRAPSTPKKEASPQISNPTTEAAQALIQGQPEEALSRAEAAIATDPRSPWAHYHKATALSALGRHEEALQSFDAALKGFAPKEAWARSLVLWGRAQTLRESGRCDEAKSAFNEYIAAVAARDEHAPAQAYALAEACRPTSERAAAQARENPAAAPSPPEHGGFQGEANGNGDEPPQERDSEKRAQPEDRENRLLPGSPSVEPPARLERPQERPVVPKP